MPKIAIDTSPLSNGNSIRGVGYYTKQLVSALKIETLSNPDFKNYQVDLVDSPTDLKKYDLVHYPYFDPFILSLPNRHSHPQIVTIHDLIPIQFKQHFPVGIKGELNWQLQKYKVKQSDFIITVSNYSKLVISNLLNYSDKRIFVTYEAADDTFKKVKNDQLLSKVKARYQLPDQFILYLGDINWNKNIRTLVDSCIELKYPLIILGSAATKSVPDHPWTKDIQWLQSIKSPYVQCLGYVNDEDLPPIFNLATIYCQASFAEGFGLPVVQAMQSGTPVIYSQETCLPEIVDNCGLAFDPYSPTSLLKTMKKLWNDSTLRTNLSQKGINRAKFFNWQKTAVQTLAVYQLALTNEK